MLSSGQKTLGSVRRTLIRRCRSTDGGESHGPELSSRQGRREQQKTETTKRRKQPKDGNNHKTETTTRRKQRDGKHRGVSPRSSPSWWERGAHAVYSCAARAHICSFVVAPKQKPKNSTPSRAENSEPCYRRGLGVVSTNSASEIGCAGIEFGATSMTWHVEEISARIFGRPTPALHREPDSDSRARSPCLDLE